MAVQKKHPVDAKVLTDKGEKKVGNNKSEVAKTAASAKDFGEPKEAVIVSDTITETIEMIEEKIPQAAKSAKPTESAPAANPLTEFKEKMTKEENPIFNTPTQKNFMWPILFIFIITLLMFGGILIYKNSTKSRKVNVVTLSPTPTVLPQPTKAIDLSKYKIEILNGSKVNGEAGRQRTNLETEGFTVASIGNADNSDYTDTIIKTKKEVDKDFIAKLKNVLSNSFTVGKTESLSEDVSVPIAIILGTKK